MKLTQRLLVLLISVTMLLSGSFVQTFAAEEATDGGSVVVSETAGSEDTEEAKEEAKEEEKAEEPKAEEPKEATPEKEEPKAETNTDVKAEPEKEDAAKEDGSKDEADKDAEKPSAGKLTFESDEYTVTLEYGKKAGIPEGTTLEVREILADSKDKAEKKEYKEYHDKSLEQLRNEKGGDSIAKLEFAKFYDITLISKGKEIEPKGDVSVKFEFNKDSRETVGKKDDAEKNLRVVHLTENEKTGKLEAAAIDKKDTDLSLEKKELAETSFTTDSFSVYGIVYTVDFEYEGYTFSIEGESDILISELFERLHIEEDASKVENVEFTDPKLIKVEQTDGDWKLTSLKPFDTEEKLTVTLADKIIEIKVTDAREGNTFNLSREGLLLSQVFRTRLFSSRAGMPAQKIMPESGQTKTVEYSTTGWLDFEQFVEKYDSQYTFPRYSVLSAGDQGDNNYPLVAAGFFNVRDIYGSVGLYPQTRYYGPFMMADAKGSYNDFDLDITLNDNSLPIQIIIDGQTRENIDVFVRSANDTKSVFAAADIVSSLKNDGKIEDIDYLIASSTINESTVESVKINALENQPLAGVHVQRPRTAVAIPPVQLPIFDHTYHEAYKWTYNNDTAVMDDAYVINLETPIARVKTGDGDWTYHSQLIGSGTQPGSTTKVGAFDQANSLSGNVVIELLKKGDDGTDDDTNGRYTLSSGFNFNNSAIKSLTLRTTQDSEWNPDKFRSTITKNQTGTDIKPIITTTGIGTLTLEDIVFDGKDIPTNGDGGGISTNALNLTVTGCTFKNCKAGDGTIANAKGGGICHENSNANGEVIITNSIFDNCSSNGTGNDVGSGGGFYTNTESLTVEGDGDDSTVEFKNCSTEECQGAGFFHQRNRGAAESKCKVTYCIFTDCKAGWSGGGMESDAWHTTVEDSKFSECSTSKIRSNNVNDMAKGGAINVYAAKEADSDKDTTLDIANCEFVNCSAPGIGGAVRSSALTTKVDDSKFYGYSETSVLPESYGCKSTKAYGGGLASTNTQAASTTTITNTSFANCNAEKYAGAVYSSNATTIIEENSSFSECESTNGYGGGVVCSNNSADSVTTITDSSFTKCKAAKQAGAVYTNTVSTTIGNSSFSECESTSEFGGGVVCSNKSADSVTAITDSTFTKCKAAKQAGAVYTDTVTTTIGNSSFSECESTNGYGGGVVCSSTSANSITTVADSSFTNCKAASKAGGAVYTETVTTTIDKSLFSECESTNGSGGGLECNNSSASSIVTVTGSTFDTCTAKTSGGGMETLAYQTNVTGSTFTNCVANTKAGGAVNIYSDNATDPSSDTSLTVKKCTFNNCSSNKDNGGAIRSNAYRTTVSDSAFTTCKSVKNGGGLASTNKNGNTTTVDKCTFTDCSAVANGGGLYLNTSNNVLTNVQVDGGSNTVNAKKGGAFYLESDKSATITDGNYTNCSGSDADGGAVNVGSAGSRLNFEGDVVIYGNPQAGGAQQKNVVLNISTNDIIRTTSNGLSSSAHIGVYVTGNMDPSESDPFKTHGSYNDDFGTYVSTNNLNRFTNDRVNDENGNPLYGEVDPNNNGRIRWTGGTIPAPTGYNRNYIPFVLILLGGAALVLLKKAADRRRRSKDSTFETEE